MEERKTFGRLWQTVSSGIIRHNTTTKWWGDSEGACPVNQSLRAINVHAEDFLKTFFKKELEGRLGFGKPFLSTWIIIVAEIEARVKENERRRAEKYERFMQYFKTKREKDLFL